MSAALPKQSLSDLLDFYNGKEVTFAENAEFPIYGSNGIIGQSSDYNYEDAIILGRVGVYCGSVARCRGRFWASDNTIVARTKPTCDMDFAYYLLKNTSINKYAGGAAQPLITHRILSGIDVQVPSIQNQRRIASILSAYDDLIANNRRRIQLLEQAARHIYKEWFVYLRFPGYAHTHIVDGVPVGWEKKTLESICTEDNGIQTGPFGSQLHQSDYTEDGVPVVMPKDIVNFRIETEGIARVSESMAEKLSRHRMQLYDIVYGRRGDIGRRAFISRRQTGWLCGSGSMRIRPNPSLINPRYLFETLGASETAGTIANRAKGSTMLNLNASIMKSVPVLVPSRNFQNLYGEQVEPISEMVETLIEEDQKLTQARDLLLPRLMSGDISV